MTNFRLHDEEMVNGPRKIAWAPFETALYIYEYVYIVPFSVYINMYILKWQHIYILLYTYMYMLPVQAENGKRKPR
jgi:hypothetical protein